MKQIFFLCIIFSLCLGVEIGVRDFRFLHAVPSGGPVDVWVNGVKTFSNLAFTALSNYTQNIDSTPSLSVMVVPAGAAANASLATKFVSTPQSSSWTLVWRLNAFNQPILDAVKVSECCLSSRRGSASIQFFNMDASGIFPAVDVTYQGGWMWKQLPATKISAFTELRAGNYTLKFSGAGGSMSLSVSLMPKVNYGLVLFGGPTFPPLLSLSVLEGCSLPNTTFALPPPPPPATFGVTMQQAQAIAGQANAEWIAAVMAYLTGTNNGLIDQFAAKWWPDAIFRGYFYPGSSPASPLNSAQTAATIKAYLNGNMGSIYSQSQGNVVLLTDKSFIFTFPYSFTRNGVVVESFVTQVFSRLPDGQFAITVLTELDFAPTGGLTVAAAEYLANQASVKYAAAVNSFLSSGNGALLEQHYTQIVSSSYTNYISPLDLWFNATGDLAHLKSVLNESAGGFFWQGPATTILLNENSFVSQFHSYLAGPGNSSVLPVWNSLTFSKQGDGLYRVVFSSQLVFSNIVPVTPTTAEAIAYQTNLLFQLATTETLESGLTLTLEVFYQINMATNYQAFYFNSLHADLNATANPLNATTDLAIASGYFQSIHSNGATFELGNATVALVGPFEFAVTQPSFVFLDGSLIASTFATSTYACQFVDTRCEWKIVTYTEFDTTPYTTAAPPTTLPPITTAGPTTTTTTETTTSTETTTTTTAETTTTAAETTTTTAAETTTTTAAETTTTTAAETTTTTTDTTTSTTTTLSVEFNYGMSNQSVAIGTAINFFVLANFNFIQVNAAGFASCDLASGANVIKVYSAAGAAANHLITADQIYNGPLYFISTEGGSGTYTDANNLTVAATGGHCTTGLKIIVSAIGATPTATATTTTETTTTQTTTTTTTTTIARDFNFGITNQEVAAGTAVQLNVLSFHNLIQVNYAGYTSCDLAGGANVIKIYTATDHAGTYTIPAADISSGPVYLICTAGGTEGTYTDSNNQTVPSSGGHCSTGLKVRIATPGATDVAPTTTMAPTTTTTTSTTTTTTTTTVVDLAFNFGTSNQTVPAGTTIHFSVLTVFNFIQVDVNGFNTCDLANGTNVVKVLAAVGTGGTFPVLASDIINGPLYFISTAGGTGSYTDPQTSLTVPSAGGLCTTGLKLKVSLATADK